MMEAYIQGRGQRTQCHLSVWMDLCTVVSQDLTIINWQDKC